MEKAYCRNQIYCLGNSISGQKNIKDYQFLTQVPVAFILIMASCFSEIEEYFPLFKSITTEISSVPFIDFNFYREPVLITE